MTNPRPYDSEQAGHVLRCRTLFISDVHLGTRGAQAEALLEFLRAHEADTIYLVGDIVDGWRLRSSWYWPQSHNDVVQKLLRRARKGARIVYVPGNHDEFLREFCDMHFGGIEVRDSIVHEAADGRRYLVIHGDAFTWWSAKRAASPSLGDWAYVIALGLRAYHAVRAGWASLLVAVGRGQAKSERGQLYRRFEETLAAEAAPPRRASASAATSTTAALREFDGFSYTTPSIGWRAAPRS